MSIQILSFIGHSVINHTGWQPQSLILEFWRFRYLTWLGNFTFFLTKLNLVNLKNLKLIIDCRSQQVKFVQQKTHVSFWGKIYLTWPYSGVRQFGGLRNVFLIIINNWLKVFDNYQPLFRWSWTTLWIVSDNLSPGWSVKLFKVN